MHDLVETLSRYDTPTIANAIELLHIRNRMTGFCSREMRQLTPEMGVMCGYAITVQAEAAVADSTPRDESVDMHIEVCRALEQAPKPAVLVYEEFGPHPAFSAHMGDVLATIYRRFGAIGAVSNGAIRDLKELRAMGFQAFAPGSVASRANYVVRRVQIPVRVCGLTVHPGDLLHGDENGLITVPEKGRDQLPELIEKVRAREKTVLDYVKGADVTLDGIRDRLAH